MGNRFRVPAILASAAVVFLAATPRGVRGDIYVEDFTTKDYCDTLNTTADWGTLAVEIRLFVFERTLAGSCDAPDRATGVAIAGDYAYVTDGHSGLQVIEVFQRQFGTERNVGQSLAVDGSDYTILQARLATTQADSVSWELSADGGANWEAVAPGTEWHTFAFPGTDLLWRSSHLYLGGGVNPVCSYLQIEWEVMGLEATIDFDPNTLNCASHGGYATCYIELPEGYDPGDIDVATVVLNDSVFAVSWPMAVGDYDSDGVPDLMVKFARGQVIALLPVGDDVEVGVAGELGDGTLFEGSDLIRVICRKGPLLAEFSASLLHVNPGHGHSSAAVSYGLAADGHVKTRVYDVAGRLVRTPVNERQSRGEHSIVWDGRSEAGPEVSGGVYFVALESADGTRTAKVVLLK